MRYLSVPLSCFKISKNTLYYRSEAGFCLDPLLKLGGTVVVYLRELLYFRRFILRIFHSTTHKKQLVQLKGQLTRVNEQKNCMLSEQQQKVRHLSACLVG